MKLGPAKAAHIELWNEKARGVNMFVCAAAPQQWREQQRSREGEEEEEEEVPPSFPSSLTLTSQLLWGEKKYRMIHERLVIHMQHTFCPGV